MVYGTYNELVTGANLNQLISTSIQSPIETLLKSINIAISWGLTASPPQDPNWATVRLPPTPHMAIVPRAEPLRLTRNLQARKSQGVDVWGSWGSKMLFVSGILWWFDGI